MEKETHKEKENALRLLAQERRSITERMKGLQADLEAIRRAEEILSENSKEAPRSPQVLEKVTTGYENMAPQEAALKLLNDRPEKSWKPAELAKALLKEGFKTSSKNFITIIYSGVKRLEAKGEVEKIKPRKGSRWLYKIKEKTLSPNRAA